MLHLQAGTSLFTGAATLLVSREVVLRRPKAMYEHFYNWILNTVCDVRNHVLVCERYPGGSLAVLLQFTPGSRVRECRFLPTCLRFRT